MKSISVFSQQNKEESMNFPTELVKKNTKLLAQAVNVYEQRSHAGRAIVKTRGEVDRTTKKWYRQKGTGNARHGSRSAPIFVGGGKAHGPSGLRKTLTLGKNQKRLSLKAALFHKLEVKHVSAISGVSELKKTKEAALLIKNFKKGTKSLVVLSEANQDKTRLFRNISNVKIVNFRNLNVFDVINATNVVFDKDSFQNTKSEKPASEAKTKKVTPKTVKTKETTKKVVKKTAKK